MQKKPYKRPEIREVKLSIEDTLLTSCRSRGNSRTGARVRTRACRDCRATFRAS